MNGEEKVGVAFIRGINFYSSRRAKSGELLELLKEAEDEDLKILGSYKSDCIIFMKSNIHYAEVGGRFEQLLGRHFKEKVYVTARSIRTLKGVLRKAGELR